MLRIRRGKNDAVRALGKCVREVRPVRNTKVMREIPRSGIRINDGVNATAGLDNGLEMPPTNKAGTNDGDGQRIAVGRHLWQIPTVDNNFL